MINFAKSISSFPKRFMIKLSNFKTKVYSKIVVNKKKIKNKTETYEHKQRVNQLIHYILDFCFVVVIYGVMVNYIVSQLLGYNFSFRLIIAWGLVSYILKSELPEIIQKCIMQNIIKK